MKVVFVTNYLNIHQLPLVENLYTQLNGKFTFISTSPITRTRVNMGFQDLDSKYDYVLTTYNSEYNSRKAMELAYNCDVLILGSASEEYMIPRLKAGKLTFRYSERFFKKGLGIRNFPRSYLSAQKHLVRFQRYRTLYFLCASAYTAADVNLFSNYSNRTYKWGYFPETYSYDASRLLEQKDRNSILWTGRLIDWKHPEASLIIAERLKAEGISFTLNIIGDGEMYSILEKRIKKVGLENQVHLLGTKKPHIVREYMEKSQIFIFTSDYNEGWGAVLNESMNSVCAVISSHATGASPFLIDDGKNGFLYNSGDNNDLYQKVKYVLTHPIIRNKISLSAYDTIQTKWNANIAATRLLSFFERLLSGEKTPKLYKDGPCSEAEFIKNNWYKTKEYY